MLPCHAHLRALHEAACAARWDSDPKYIRVLCMDICTGIARIDCSCMCAAGHSGWLVLACWLAVFGLVALQGRACKGVSVRAQEEDGTASAEEVAALVEKLLVAKAPMLAEYLSFGAPHLVIACLKKHSNRLHAAFPSRVHIH